MPVYIQTLLKFLFLPFRETTSSVSTVQITDHLQNHIGS